MRLLRDFKNFLARKIQKNLSTTEKNFSSYIPNIFFSIETENRSNFALSKFEFSFMLVYIFYFIFLIENRTGKRGKEKYFIPKRKFLRLKILIFLRKNIFFLSKIFFGTIFFVQVEKQDFRKL